MPINRRGFSKNMKGFDTRNITAENIFGSVKSDEVITGFLQADEIEVGAISFTQVGTPINFTNQELSNVNIVSGPLVSVDSGVFNNVTVNGNIDLTLTTSELRVNGNKVVGARQPASATVPTVTTKGTNIGVSGPGLSLIGNTSTVDQSLLIMNDFESLREDIVNLKTAVDGIRTVLINHGLMG